MQIKAFKGVRVDVFEVSGVDESRAARCDFCVRRMGPGERGATLSRGGEDEHAADEDVRGGAPRPPCTHVWRAWTTRSGQTISDCALCGERAKAAITICRYCAARFNQIVQRVKP